MANIITLLRFPFLFVYIALLYTHNPTVVFWCTPLIVLITLMDTFDGLIARARGEVSLLGSTLDIAVDRAFEIILWVVYAHLGLIPILIPIIVITNLRVKKGWIPILITGPNYMWIVIPFLISVGPH